MTAMRERFYRVAAERSTDPRIAVVLADIGVALGVPDAPSASSTSASASS